MLTLKDAFQTRRSGIALAGGSAGIFFGNASPAIEDDGTAPVPSLYFRANGELWVKTTIEWKQVTSAAGRITALIDAGNTAHAHANLVTLDAIQEAFTTSWRQSIDDHVSSSVPNPHGLTPTSIGAAPVNHTHAGIRRLWLYDKRPSRSSGSKLKEDKWNDRAILQVVDPTFMATVTGDTFTLEGGSYSLKATISGFGRVRLINDVTGVTLLVGMESDSMMQLNGEFSVVATDALRLQHWATKDKYEKSLKDGDEEVFLSAEVVRVS